MKREAASMPVIGRSCVETECAFLVRGGDRDSDLGEIAKCARVARHDRASVIIFPEGTRFRGPKQGSGLERVLPPKSGGLQALMAELPGHAVLSVTIAWDRDIRNGKDLASSLGSYVGAKVRVHARLLEGLQPQHVEAWLRTEWLRKDEALSETG
jgi:1-acyl-sn-glycerol-3-phosphate acyltransferase